MKYFAVFLPMLDKEKSQKYRENHLDYLETKRKEGKIFLNGKFSDGAGGLVIYYVETIEEVTKLVHEDPYVIEKARGYEIHEWEMVGLQKD
ncbi:MULTISPECIES: YciI family protein [Shouchella]|uniref:YCII-related domain-containing protein n=3 Tax=Bacillaceae TaxID=186817 RepID=A0A060M6M9_9BACI|nr:MULTISPECIES: YciI family protein [Bacillaceae]AIC95759.1 hypothetical protein BleG1_3205 [Shouchella lehensis G1]KQL57215.1 hypothetical protein AN965_09970 [Alkalicoccobacillus plakortidis]MBG9784746.1 hypothetical protein [Shouchella lehensis]TES46148.1 hypothetical protein E2L03_15615 [Shouchella lehensis]